MARDQGIRAPRRDSRILRVGSARSPMFDLPPGAERTVQYADFLGRFDVAQGKPRVSFVLVTIPSEVSRGVVARSVAALSKGPVDPSTSSGSSRAQARDDGAQGKANRLLGYIENMSGYYCRDCNAIKPLFTSEASAKAEPSGLKILASGPSR